MKNKEKYAFTRQRTSCFGKLFRVARYEIKILKNDEFFKINKNILI